jgi:glycerophosphoryl diester phosphodiesterase
MMLSGQTQQVSRYLGNAGTYPVAHRGGCGLGPENSLAAFSRAHALGFRYLETDIRITADGVCVAFHDRTLRRVLAAPGTVRGTSWQRLRDLRFRGEAVPTLDELLDMFPDACFMMDLKDPDALDPVIEILQRHRAVDRVCLAGAADRWLSAGRERAGPGLSTSLGWESMILLAGAAWAGASSRRLADRLPEAEFIHVPRYCGAVPVYCERLVALAHDLGLRVMVWTIDDATVVAGLLDQGVDGIITGRPDVLREVLIARDAWTTPIPRLRPGSHGGRSTSPADGSAEGRPPRGELDRSAVPLRLPPPAIR